MVNYIIIFLIQFLLAVQLVLSVLDVVCGI